MASTDIRLPSKLTVVMEFQGRASRRSLSVMEQEAEGILKPAGLQLDWRLAADAARESFDDLVVVQFRGSCQVESTSTVHDESGPMAFTHSSDGNIQPFTEILCGTVAASVRSAMGGDDSPRAEVLYGRALGRVLAHELVHVLTGSEAHGRDGVQRAAFTGKDLISASLVLDRADLVRLQQAGKRTKAEVLDTARRRIEQSVATGSILAP